MSFHTTIARLREASFAAPAAGENPNTCRVGRQDLRTALHVIDRLDADLRQAGTLAHGTLAHGAVDAAPRAVNAPVANSIQWPTMPACKGQSPVLFEDGYAEGWAKCMDECRRAVSQARAPVAGEAVAWEIPNPHLGSELTSHKARADEARRLGLTVHELFRHAAPQSSEAARDASDMDDLRSRVLAAIHDCAALTPEDDESWDEWYCAAFDLLGSRVGEIFRVALSAQPADKPATPRAAPAPMPRQQCVCRLAETGNAHTDGGAVYE